MNRIPSKANLVINIDPPVLRVVSPRRERPAVIEQPLEPTAIRMGAIADVESVRETLRKCLQQLSLRDVKPRYAWWVLPLEAIAEIVVKLPPVTKADLRPAVERAILNWLGSDAPPLVKRWKIVERSHDHISVYISAIRADVTGSLEELAKSVGLKTMGISGLVPLLASTMPHDGFVLHASTSGQVAGIMVKNKIPAWILREELDLGRDPIQQLTSAAEVCRADGHKFERIALSGAADNGEVISALKAEDAEAGSSFNWPGNVLMEALGKGAMNFVPDGDKTYLQKNYKKILAGILAAEVAAFGAAYRYNQGRMNALEASIAETNRVYAQKQSAINEIKALQGQLEALRKEAEAASPQDEVDWNRLWAEVTSVMGPCTTGSVDWDEVPVNGSYKVSVEGTGPSLSAVASLLTRLETGSFSAPFLSSLAIDEDKVTFSYEVRWTP